LLEWVTKHGLLGILPHTFETSLMPLQRGEVAHMQPLLVGRVGIEPTTP
jgi:hypothetical protein